MKSSSYSTGSSSSRSILTILAIVLVITAFVLVGLNALKTQSSKTSDQYTQGFLAARTMYTQMCPMVRNEQSATTLTGTVQSNNGSSLVILANNLDTDQKIDGVGLTRTVTVTADTKIQQTTQKTSIELSQEVQAFIANHATGTRPTPPSPYTVTNLSLSEIKAGDVVTIQSGAPVRLLQTIPAVSIGVSKP